MDNLLLTAESYNWGSWYSNMRLGADTVNAANPNILIFMGGIHSDTTLYPIPTGSDLASGITGEILYVDAGFNIMGFTFGEESKTPAA